MAAVCAPGLSALINANNPGEIIVTDANDSAALTQAIEKFYNAILKRLRDGNIKAILCTPAAIGEKTDFSNQQDGDMNSYSNIIRSIAQKNNLPLVDLRRVFLEYNKKNNPENKDRGILTTDRVHLNAKGDQMVADEMWKVIKRN